MAEEYQLQTGVEVVLVTGGSSVLREQILDGADASVFASANQSVMSELAQRKVLATDPQVFAVNRLVMVVEPGNPYRIGSIADLGDQTLLVGACAQGVPCGDLAQEVFDAAGVQPTISTFEPNVRSVLAKVLAGELDVGLVYATDGIASGDTIEAIDLGGQLPTSTQYPIGVLADGGNRLEATRFVDWVLSPEGQRILVDHGFELP